MTDQPIPKVTGHDLDRIVRRDLPPERFEEVISILGRHRDRERLRVCAAALKLADGDIDRLQHFLAQADTDYRDVLLWAEYPTASAGENWRQYQDWFSR